MHDIFSCIIACLPLIRKPLRIYFRSHTLFILVLVEIKMHTKTNTQKDAHKYFTQVSRCGLHPAITIHYCRYHLTMSLVWSLDFILLFVEAESHDHCRPLLNPFVFIMAIMSSTSFFMAIISSMLSSSMAMILSIVFFTFHDHNVVHGFLHLV